MSEPNHHDRTRALRSALGIADDYEMIFIDLGIVTDRETKNVLVAKIEAAILAAVAAKGEPLAPWEDKGLPKIELKL
jgi:hypothetical protein